MEKPSDIMGECICCECGIERDSEYLSNSDGDLIHKDCYDEFKEAV